MGTIKSSKEPFPGTVAQPRGTALADGANMSPPDRNPDTQLRLEGETDDLYDDGIDVESGMDEPPAGTRGDSFGIKP